MELQTDNKNKQVYVALSGGVDSSVALALLRDEGYAVTGVYFKTYKPDGNREYCRQQGMDAQAVCRHLGVPFKVLDLEEEYKQKVFDYMIHGYTAGQTPNPDMMCNRDIKFGIFAQRAFADGADYIATGHYARVQSTSAGSILVSAIDENKDQTYFLSQISQEILARSLFPIGEYKKNDIRALAKKYGLHTADKKDSQGICFIGQEIDVKAFLKRYIPEQEGDVLTLQGDVIGTHHGARFSTIGERHGFVIDPQHQTPEMPRLFVIRRDIPANTITVGTLTELEAVQQSITAVHITDTHWLTLPPEKDRDYTCRIRHRGERYVCRVACESGSASSVVTFTEPPYAPASGQFVAVYDGDICLGGGVME